MSNEELAEELHSPIIRKYKSRKVHSSFIDNTWDPDHDHMQFMSKFNKRIRLLCVVDIFSKYAQVFPLKIKKVLQLLMLFKKF